MNKGNDNCKHIYIVFVKARTGLGKFARLFSDYEYTHVAVCLNGRKNDFLTFSRRRHNAPFDSGFMHETLDCYAFGKYQNIKLKIYKIPVKAERKRQIEKYITEIEKDTEYIFNLYSMATMSVVHGLPIYKAENCMSFVARILQLSEAVEMKEPYYRYNIREIEELLGGYPYREGLFYKTKIQTRNYMEHVSFAENLHLFLELNRKLLARMICKKDEEGKDTSDV